MLDMKLIRWFNYGVVFTEQLNNPLQNSYGCSLCILELNYQFQIVCKDASNDIESTTTLSLWKLVFKFVIEIQLFSLVIPKTFRHQWRELQLFTDYISICNKYHN